MTTPNTNTTLAIQQPEYWTREKIDLLKRTLMPPKTSDDELEMYMHFVKRSGLDPFAGQVHAVKRWDTNKNCDVLKIQTGIDGFRLTAQRTGEFEGTLGPFWCGTGGTWVDVWLSKDPPAAAKVGAWRKGFREPVWAVARWTDYRVLKKDGSLSKFWLTMAPLMLGKCAEALALRRAFPMELSGMYTDDEMAQATREQEPEEIRPAETVPAENTPPAGQVQVRSPQEPPAEEDAERKKLAELRAAALADGWPDLRPALLKDGRFTWRALAQDHPRWLNRWFKNSVHQKPFTAWSLDEIRAAKAMADFAPKPNEPQPEEAEDQPPKPSNGTGDPVFPEGWYKQPMGWGRQAGLTWEQAATQIPKDLARQVADARATKGRPTKTDSRGWNAIEQRCLVALNMFNGEYLKSLGKPTPLPASTPGGDDADR